MSAAMKEAGDWKGVAAGELRRRRGRAVYRAALVIWMDPHGHNRRGDNVRACPASPIFGPNMGCV